MSAFFYQGNESCSHSSASGISRDDFGVEIGVLRLGQSVSQFPRGNNERVVQALMSNGTIDNIACKFLFCCPVLIGIIDFWFLHYSKVI